LRQAHDQESTFKEGHMTINGLQPGDILVTRTPGAWPAAMIRLGSALLDKPNLSNHVAVVHHWDDSGTLWVIEGRPGGVGWRNASDYLSSRWTLSNVAQPKTDAQRKVITDGAVAILGMPYDWAAIIGDGLDDLHLWSPVHGQVQGHAVCSAVAALLYDKAALGRPAGDERKVQPAAWDEWIITQGWTVAR
jgi:hypothetical protein